MFGARASSHASADLHRRRAETPRDVGQDRRLQRRKPAEREERHVGDSVARELVDQRVVGPVRDVVEVLHADDLADLASLGDLRRRDVAQADVAHQTLALELGQHGQRRLDRSLDRAVNAEMREN